MEVDLRAIEAAKGVLASREAADRSKLLSRGARRHHKLRAISIRQAAQKHSLTRWQVEQAIKWIRDDVGPRGRPPYLLSHEDDALVSFVALRDEIGFAAGRNEVQTAAWTIRKHRIPDSGPPGTDWYRNWRQNHPQLAPKTMKAMERERRAFEASDPANIETFYQDLERTTVVHGIGPSELWNEDEVGIRMGVVRGRNQVLVVRGTRRQRPQVHDFDNRESTTMIGAGNAIGDVIPPYMIFKVFPTESWATADVDDNIRFARSETGFSNGEIMMDWIKHFNSFSWKSSAKAQRSGKTLEEWFGCNEHLQVTRSHGQRQRVEQPPRERNPGSQIFRLLIIDGFTGHTSIDVLEYCLDFDIIIIFLPPHSTHLMQPMDIGVFQPLKNAHQRALLEAARDGKITFSREDFLDCLNQIIEAGFSRHNIMRGFEKSGLWPLRKEAVLETLISERWAQGEAIEERYRCLLPPSARFQSAINALNALEADFRPQLTPLHTDFIGQIRSAISEGAMLSGTLQQFKDSKQKRTESWANRKKPGAMVKPSGLFVNSVTIAEIRLQRDKALAKAEAEMIRKQHYTILKETRAEIKSIRTTWQKDKTLIINGERKQIRLYKEWCQHTGNDIRLASLEQTVEAYSKILYNKTPTWSIDIEKHNTPEVQEAIKVARMLPKPLENMTPLPLPRFPDSDTIKVTTTGQFSSDLIPSDAPTQADPNEHNNMPSSPPWDTQLPSSPAPSGEAEAPSQMPPMAPPTRRTTRYKDIIHILRNPLHSSHNAVQK
jgi:hypothetical protein